MVADYFEELGYDILTVERATMPSAKQPKSHWTAIILDVKSHRPWTA